MITGIVANLKPLPYQGSALPLSYDSAGARYALGSHGNQRFSELSGKIGQLAIRAVLSGTKRGNAGLCGTFRAHLCSAPVLPLPVPPAPLGRG
jgi:hypothetical protein